MTEEVDVYIAAPSAKDHRPRVVAFFAGVRAIVGARVAHDWVAIMDRQGDRHLPEAECREEGLADLEGAARARVVFVLTGPVDRHGYTSKPATSGGALVELGATLERKRRGEHVLVVQVGETWPHPLFGALVDLRFETDALALAWLAGFVLARRPLL